jgi:hypothetical protein|tara:strand:+ start:5140 stop:5409 length:270 start_codon:yes stop_codon:yes gene_type:complete
MTTQPNVNITLKDQRLFIFDELQRVNCTSDVDGSNYCMQSSIYNDMVEWAIEAGYWSPTGYSVSTIVDLYAQFQGWDQSNNPMQIIEVS